MKNQILCIAAAMTLLCACAARNAPISGQSSSTAAPVPPAAEEIHTGEMRALSAGNEGGYYLTGNRGGNQLLCYIDYEQAVEVPLCTSPSCAHDSETCTAWIPGDQFIASFVSVDENTIAFIRSPSDGAQTIEVADATGANRRVLYTAESGQFLQTIACADSEALYFLSEELSGSVSEMRVYRVPLSGSAAQPEGAYPSPSPELLGVSGRNLVLYQYDWGDTTEEAEANGCEHRVFLWNPETGEETTLDTWHSDARSNGRSVCWDDGRLYWVSSDTADALHWLDEAGGSGQVDVAWPAEVTGAAATFTLERIVDGRALVTVWGPWGTDLLKRYLADVSGESATATEIPLRFVSNASERPIEILAETDGELLVHFAQQDSFATQVQEDGYPTKTVEISNRYGMISWEDFLAGIPNYREITAP